MSDAPREGRVSDVDAIERRRALAGNAPLWAGAALLHVFALGFAARASHKSEMISALPGVALQSVLLAGGLVMLVRASRAAGVGLLRCAGAVLGGLVAIAAVGAVGALFVGLAMLAVGAIVSGGMNEGVGSSAVLLAPVAAWLIAVAASPLGASAYEPSRQIHAEEVAQSQRAAIVMATISVVAGVLSGHAEKVGWPMMFVPVTTAIGSAIGLLGARAVGGQKADRNA